MIEAVVLLELVIMAVVLVGVLAVVKGFIALVLVVVSITTLRNEIAFAVVEVAAQVVPTWLQ